MLDREHDALHRDRARDSQRRRVPLSSRGGRRLTVIVLGASRRSERALVRIRVGRPHEGNMKVLTFRSLSTTVFAGLIGSLAPSCVADYDTTSVSRELDSYDEVAGLAELAILLDEVHVELAARIADPDPLDDLEASDECTEEPGGPSDASDGVEGVASDGLELVEDVSQIGIAYAAGDLVISEVGEVGTDGTDGEVGEVGTDGDGGGDGDPEEPEASCAEPPDLATQITAAEAEVTRLEGLRPTAAMLSVPEQAAFEVRIAMAKAVLGRLKVEKDLKAIAANDPQAALKRAKAAETLAELNVAVAKSATAAAIKAREAAELGYDRGVIAYKDVVDAYLKVSNAALDETNAIVKAVAAKLERLEEEAKLPKP
jgi:hypothetical protein